MAEQTKAVAKREDEGQGTLRTVRELLLKNKDQFAMALPKTLSVDRLLRISLTAIQKNPQLLECHPATLAGAVLTAAIWGLEPIGAGGCWFVPFRNTTKNRSDVQFIADYRGLVKIARNSGDVLKVEPRAVHAKDKFNFQYGTNPRIDHVPYQGEGGAGDLTHVYAVGFYRDGSTQFIVLDKEAIEKARKASKAGDSGPWKSHFEDMAIKTAVRRLCKQLPMDPEKQALISQEEKGELQIPQDLGQLVDPGETPSIPVEEQKPIAPPQRKGEPLELKG